MSTHVAVVDTYFMSRNGEEIATVDGETSYRKTPFTEFKRGGNGVRDGDGGGWDFLKRGN